MKKVLSLLLTLCMIFSAAPSFAYNAEPSILTGGMDGLQMAKKVAEEGMVLLENNDALPLKKGERIAIFGINQLDFIYGGGGSGNFNSKNERVDYISLYDALKTREEAGDIVLYEDLLNSYEAYYNSYWSSDGRTYGYGTKQGSVLKYWGEMEISENDVASAAEEADTAIITIGRPAGEDSDRSNSEGDFKLNTKEKNMINYVKNAGFEKVVVILNVTGVIESDWLKDDAIDAVLYVSLPGMVGGEAMADVLMGDSYPSGKLVDTWAANYTDYPSSANFGNSSYTNYKEDIFVGYRYFETIPNAKDKVNYPFGYGLSYADFEITDKKVTVTGIGRERQVTVTATVTNSGEHPGKEVVQVYYSAPEAALTQPSRELCGFYKTKELKGGESEKVVITFPFDNLASYDDTGNTGYEAAYVLEKGEYKLYVGNNVRAEYTDSFTLEETELVEQLEHHLVPDTTKLNQRLTSDGTYETIEQKENAPVSEDPKEDVDARFKEVYTNEAVAENEDAFITFNELAKAFSDGESEEDTKLLEAFVARLTDEEAVKLTGCTSPVSGKGHRTGIAGLDAYGVPIIGTSNGPAGIQYNGSQSTWETTSTFYPCATMQACTWNEELIEQLGAAMADEARYFGMSLWQAPGMNIHRDPLCGRNFEYFSEDPYVTGKIGAAITRGVQSRKFASQLKHFAFNNQEKGRWGNDSRISERAIREIYLKGYEIAIKESNPWSIMSSYNRINGTQTSGSYQLLTEILRNEWGYEGFVMTDFRTQNVSHSQEIFAGNDLKAPADSPRPENVYSALASGSLERWQVNRSAERVLRFVLKTEDAELLADEEFDYNVTVSVNSDKITVSDTKIKLTDTISWGEFLESLSATYGQSYVLLDGKGSPISDENTLLEIGMKIKVTAEDGITEKIFEISGESLALNKAVKASYTQSGYPESNAVDGSYATRWSGFSQNYVWGDWIEVDLGEDYHITRIDVSYYKGDERTYSYEVRVAPSTSNYWSDTNKDRDFDSQGYSLVASGDTSYTTLHTDNVNIYGRFVNLKTTDSVGAFGPTLWEFEVYGWKLESDEYIIDEENKTIAVWDGDTTSDAVSKLKVSGLATIEFAGENDTWVNEGEKFVITDQNGVKTEYTVVTLKNYNTDLEVSDTMTVDNNEKLLFVTGEDKAETFASLVRNLYNAKVEYIDTNKDGFINMGDSVKVVAEDGFNTACYTVIEACLYDNAVSATATYTENSSYVADNVIDGSLSTRWSAYNKGVNQAICIDLGEEKTITAIGSYWFGDGRESTYNIYVTDTPTIVGGKFTEPEEADKKNLKSYGSGVNGGEGSLETFDILYKKGRYVTIYTTANSNNVVSLWEIDIYTAPEGEDIVIEAEERSIVGIYNSEGILIKALWAEGETVIKYDARIAYIKIFSWDSVNILLPLKEVQLIEVDKSAN